jgi:hypothetical protein
VIVEALRDGMKGFLSERQCIKLAQWKNSDAISQGISPLSWIDDPEML